MDNAKNVFHMRSYSSPTCTIMFDLKVKGFPGTTEDNMLAYNSVAIEMVRAVSVQNKQQCVFL